MDLIEALLAGADRRVHRSERPWVTLTYAQSLDGCIAARRGQALALSGSQSLALTHQLRAAHDAILVGIGTVLADNPRLTVRLVEGKNPQPLVVDSQLRFPLDARLLRNNALAPWIATREAADQARQRALEKSGARVLHFPVDSNGGVCLNAVLEHLLTLGIKRLMVEGGARIITSFLRERLVDFLVLTVSPVWVGGLHAVEQLGEPDPACLPRLRRPRCEWLGEDLILWGHLARGTP